MRKHKKKKPAPHDPDAEAIAGVILAMMAGMGRGGLTWMSNRLGVTPSCLRKRLLNPETAFDAVTMRAILLVKDSQAEGRVTLGDNLVPVDEYQIFLRTEPDGSTTPFWFMPDGQQTP